MIVVILRGVICIVFLVWTKKEANTQQSKREQNVLGLFLFFYLKGSAYSSDLLLLQRKATAQLQCEGVVKSLMQTILGDLMEFSE